MIVVKRVAYFIALAASIAGVFIGIAYSCGLDEFQLRSLRDVFVADFSLNASSWITAILITLIIPAIIAFGALCGLGVVFVPLGLAAYTFSFSSALAAIRLAAGEFALKPTLYCLLPKLLAFPFLLLFCIRLLERALEGKKGRGTRPGPYPAQAFLVTLVFAVSAQLISMFFIGFL